MSLTTPHPIWRTTGSNPYEVTKAVQQAQLLSGRYRTEQLATHWSKNKEGFCLVGSCMQEVETVSHMLITCPAFLETRKRLCVLWLSSPDPHVLLLVIEALTGSPNNLLQFLLDCSVLPSVILATQRHGFSILQKLFYLTRTWCFSIHRKRLKILGRWNPQ